MKLNRASDEALFQDVTADVDLTPATLLVSVDGGPFETWPWVGPAVAVGEKWTRRGRRQCRGPDADASTSLLLALGRHTVTWKLAGIDPEKPARDADPVDVG